MKICVILTGGTIGSAVHDGWISNSNSVKTGLLNRYECNDIAFDVSAPYTLLSENLSANELNILQAEIIKNISKGYDGIIVTHGTDTLHYAAVAAEYAVGASSVPVLFVSSDYPLEDERANGYANFEAAIAFIKQGATGGVFVSYKNATDDHTSIHIPSQMLRHQELNADIFSIDGAPFAVYENGILTKNGKKSISAKGLGKVDYLENSGILVIDSHPGDSFSYSLYGVRSVIFIPYHSATLNTASPALHAFCQTAAKMQIPLFALGTKEATTYETSKLYNALGITPLSYGTYVSAYMKIWVAISLGYDKDELIKKFF